ncbi:MAG: hypothetical protein AAGU11_05180, partial [Syntrophobacteraceae bacterium]
MSERDRGQATPRFHTVFFCARRKTDPKATTLKTHETVVAADADARWLALLCVARMGFSFIFTTYSAALPLLKVDWEMSASQSGMIQSAWHFGTIISLFTAGFMCDRFGAKRT